MHEKLIKAKERKVNKNDEKDIKITRKSTH